MERGLERLWEIDFARGFAVVAMVAFNWLFALGFFNILQFDASQGFWWVFARATAGAFIFIAGVSLWLSKFRHLQRGLVLRGARVFFCGMLVTAATALFLKEGVVLFGILHLVGVSIILGVLLLGWRVERLLLLALTVFVAGVTLSQYAFSFDWLLWAGFAPERFYTIDYFPLLPWFSLFVLGLAFAKKFYPNGKRGLVFAKPFFAFPLVFLGRHSLAFYLLHQPLLIAVLYALGFKPF